MDGNQKIKASILILAIIALLSACQTQKSQFIGLYVDDEEENSNIISDNIQRMITSDSLAVEAVNWDFLNEKDTLPLDDFYKKYDVFSNDTLVKLERNRMYVSNNDLDKNRLKPIDTVLISNIENQKDVENQNATSQKIQYQLDDFYDQNERLKKQNKQRAKESSNNLKQERKVERRNTVVPIIVPSEKDDTKNQTLIAAQNDTINRLKNQLEAQTPTDSLEIQKSLTTVPLLVQSKTIDSVANQNPMVRNDSIQGLKKNLVAAPKVIQFTTVDTVFVEKKVTEIQLKTIEPLTFITFYDLGKTEPNNNVLDEIIPILKAENVIKVELSGFTDSTGNAAFNKQLTDKRLNFVQSTIKQFVPIKNIFVQNFGQTFASQKSLNDDRKVEIRIYLKNEEKSIKN